MIRESIWNEWHLSVDPNNRKADAFQARDVFMKNGKASAHGLKAESVHKKQPGSQNDWNQERVLRQEKLERDWGPLDLVVDIFFFWIIVFFLLLTCLYF